MFTKLLERLPAQLRSRCSIDTARTWCEGRVCVCATLNTLGFDNAEERKAVRWLVIGAWREEGRMHAEMEREWDGESQSMPMSWW